ncbi:gliding motility-associated C-terminal domain-containing protein [Maribacter sedimenticola]|uniref:Gliding motility-associated C-terminal domain-containing protein n=1 Tax=Maribacter sedimenticola TaxID=228956 RepID=A0ABY1SKP2_9FLAO|nr:T9SS type B sorting domain-containing protein [Maribacter sedimenticola]SNR71419.1 gliding motility-associated C-terminal domain-containing protein [Maribacter sedimenticola]
MNKKYILFIIYIGFGLNMSLSLAQECPTMTSPLDGDINVPLDNLITWTEVDGIIGYLVSLGTTPGGGEIINRRSSGLNNYYQPEIGLPANTRIYVTISLFLPDAPIKVCPLKVFDTASISEPPNCTTLASPLNGESEVRVDTNIKWNYAYGATNYSISIGESPGNYNIIENHETGNTLFYRADQNFALDQTIYVRVVPLNEYGMALNCTEESFTTGVPTVQCNTNDFPSISMPDKIPFCTSAPNAIYTANDIARGYRWYKLNENGTEQVISNTASMEYNEVGFYRLELFNTVSEFGATIECPVSKIFEVVNSDIPVIENVIISRDADQYRIEVVATSPTPVEYSLESADFGFQDSPVFIGIAPGDRIVYVRDKLGCGLSKRPVEEKLEPKDFPAFFTPNGDNINDYWNITEEKRKKDPNIEYIHIFDRYGNLLAQVNPQTNGWDGTFNGKDAPEADYWFKAQMFSNKMIKGHFSLKR